ncbi:hypothetical protein, partial [Streptomyces sp. NPDC005507]|uniref:hypothetical protein n=1 Tax=Streptomyces sp. NPDC005507 TaxID=3154885 RepID=UPI0033AADB29
CWKRRNSHHRRSAGTSSYSSVHRPTIERWIEVQPLAADRGLPVDASEAVAREHASWGLSDVHGTTWITWAELLAADWQETDISGKRTREQAAGDASHWGPAWSVMRTLSDLHGAANVRLIVWFS